jgi:hypothetical protein
MRLMKKVRGGRGERACWHVVLHVTGEMMHCFVGHVLVMVDDVGAEYGLLQRAWVALPTSHV